MPLSAILMRVLEAAPGSSLSDLDKILLTALVTAVVAIAGQLLAKFLVEPIHEYRKVIGGVAYALMYHAHYFADSGPVPPEQVSEIEKAADEYRRLACDLMARTVAVPGYRVLGAARMMRPYSQMLDARGALWGLANALARPDFELKLQRAREAAKALKLTAIDPGLFRLE